MAYPSYYFTLFKKFQCLGHVAQGTVHGHPTTPQQGVSFRDPLALPGASIPVMVNGAAQNVPLIGSTSTDSPLRGVLNAKAQGTAPFYFPLGNTTQPWFPMPTGNRAAWNDSTVGGPALVQAFDAWLLAGKPIDFPAFIVQPNTGTVPVPLDVNGASVFVCSSASDDGTRPGTIPADYWSSSLIYLTDPATGAQANPPTLKPSTNQEYHVTAVIGNRGNATAGKYANGPTTATTPGVEASAWAMTFGTGGASPAVRLPSLSNLDINSAAGTHDVYFLPSAAYDIVGFRLNVRSVFNGLVAAINDAVLNSGTFTLPVNVTAEQWLTAPPSHVCLKVAVRRDDQNWPAHDDLPTIVPGIAQKNLVVFDTELLSPPAPGQAPSPVLFWKYFTLGGPLAALLRSLRRNDSDVGSNRLRLQSDFTRRAARVLIAVPQGTFGRWFDKAASSGFKRLDADACRRVRVPFEDHVVLEYTGADNALVLPFLDNQVLPMALGLEIDPARLKAGATHRVSLHQHTVLPEFGAGKSRRSYTLKESVVGGFTLEFRPPQSRTKRY